MMKTQKCSLSEKDDRRTHKRYNTHHESRLQQTCVSWFNYQHHQLRGLLFAVPNGGRRSATEAAIMKGEGVVAGVADLILMVPNKTHHALCIEMKTPQGRQSDLQKLWQEKVTKQGYRYEIARTLDDFETIVDNYLDDC